MLVLFILTFGIRRYSHLTLPGNNRCMSLEFNILSTIAKLHVCHFLLLVVKVVIDIQYAGTLHSDPVIYEN